MVFSYLAGRLAANGGLSRTFLFSWVGVVVAANVGYSIVYRPLASAPAPATVSAKTAEAKPPGQQQ